MFAENYIFPMKQIIILYYLFISDALTSADQRLVSRQWAIISNMDSTMRAQQLCN